MANFDIIVIENGRNKRKPSQDNTFDFESIRVGADQLQIEQTGSGGTAAFDFNSKKISNVALPTEDSDVATKQYADAVATGLDFKNSVRCATTANIGLSGLLTIDNVTVVAGDRVLVKNQGTASQNGIYVAAAGAWSRADDANSNDKVSAGMFCFVSEGDTWADTGWVLATNDPINLNTTALTFVQFSSAGIATAGNGISVSGTTVSVNHDGEGLQFSGVQLALELDGSTLSKSGSGLKVADAGITATQIASSVAGDGLAGGAGSALSVNVGDGVRIASDAVALDYAKTMTNDNAGAITVRQIVYVKSDGDVDLALASVASLHGAQIGIVRDASIASASSGAINLRTGALIGGFSGLTPGAKQYVSRSSAGAMTESLSGFVAGEFVVEIGHAVSATEIVFNPQFLFEY